MKTKYFFASAILASMFFTGCTDMDTFPESDIVTSEQKEGVVETDPSKAEAGINAIFSQFSAYMPITDSRHNDFGYPSVMMFTDSNGFDCLSKENGYNWTRRNLNYEDRNYTSDESKIIWSIMYRMIYAANNVISSISPTTTNPTSQFYLGQALADRAFSYWILAQLYQFNYADHKSALCVPLVTEKNAATVSVDGAPRSTVEQVYAQITTDINSAVELLTAAKNSGLARKDKRYIDLGVAYGIRARVHLTMENWAAAAEDAQKAIDTSGATPYGLTEANQPTMYDSNDHAWMWGIIIAETDRVVTSGIVNWPSHMGSLNYGYCNYSGAHQISKNLYNSIADSDIRKGWWINESRVSANLTPEQQATINGYRYRAYTSVKFAPYKNVLKTSVNANHIPLMRVEEMYLIKAEGQAMGGNAAAKTTLENFIKTYRDPSYTAPAASGKELQEEIFRQRRIELWGEGMSWFDIMRLKKPVDRRGAGYPDETMVFNIPAGSPILLWRIPESEIQANPALGENDNNPSAPQPEPVADIE